MRIRQWERVKWEKWGVGRRVADGRSWERGVGETAGEAAELARLVIVVCSLWEVVV